MFTLLQLLQAELESLTGTIDGSDIEAALQNGVLQISAVTRRVLPSLRQYSSWLMSKAEVLADLQNRETPLSVQIKELWKIYAGTLTLLASTFPVHALPTVDYLLEEDEETVGFAPFENEPAVNRYYFRNSDSKKPKWHHKGIERQHPNIEMFARIRDFLIEGLLLACDEVS